MELQLAEIRLSKILELIQSGKVNLVIKELRDLLISVPNYDKAMYFLAVSLYEVNKLKEAADIIEKALKLNPDLLYINDASNIFFDLAISYYEAKDIKNAVKYYEKCLLLNPDEKEVIQNLGACHFENDNLQEAERYFSRLIQLEPENILAYRKLGNVYEKQGQYDIALKLLFKALELDRNNPEVLFQIGIIYTKKKEYDAAVNYFYKSYERNQNDFKTCYNLGLALYKENKKAESISWYEKSIEINPDFYEGYLNLGLSLCSADRYKESILMYKKALELKPDSIDTLVNMSVSHFYNGDDEKAENCYNKAYEIDPENIESIVGQGFVCQFKNNLEEAAKCYEKALLKDCEHPYANFNMSNIHLLKGNFKIGWDLYEWRFKLNSFARPYIPKFKQPKWNGESLKDKTLYIYPEQGFGDAIQFSRFFPQLVAMDGKVIFKAKEGLMQLFRENYKNIELIEYLTIEDSLNFDFYIPLMSLARIFDINTDNIPLSKGYLKPNKELVKNYKEKYFNNNEYKVGIFWQGNPKGLINRSIPLKKLLPLTEIKGIKIYSFQKGYGIEQLETLPANVNVENLGQTFNNFADTAAAMENLDLMISTDTAITHLAGAIAKKTLLLLPYASEWRWLQDIDYSPWYDSLKLIRQSEFKNWDNVVKGVCGFIEKEIKTMDKIQE